VKEGRIREGNKIEGAERRGKGCVMVVWGDGRPCPNPPTGEFLGVNGPHHWIKGVH